MTHIDEIFKKGLENHEVCPSENVWKNVAGAKVFANKRTKNIYPWAIAASLILLLSAGIYTWKTIVGYVEGTQPGVVHVEKRTNTESQSPNEVGGQQSNQPSSVLLTDTTQVSPPSKQENAPEVKRNTSNKTPRKSRHPQQWQRSEMRFVHHESAPAGERIAQLDERTESESEWSAGLSMLTYEIQPLHNKPYVLDKPNTEQIRLAAEVHSEKTPVGLRSRFFRSAKDRLTDWAEHAGIPVTDLAGITEIEILY